MNADRVKLVQFQCKREGTLFYYQHTQRMARALVQRCPLCGTRRVEDTGRVFPLVREDRPIKPERS